MNLKQLEYVIEISKCGSMNKAAQNLYVSQPSLSGAIKQLERELGFDVFARKSSGIELTSEGKMLLLSARMIVEESQRIRCIPTLFDSQKNLSVAGTWSSLLMCGFLQFRNAHPVEGVRDELKETSFQQAVRDVMDQNYRLSIVSCLDSRSELHRLELQKYHISMERLAANVPPAAILSQDHCLSRFPQLTVAQLRQCALATYDIFNSDDWMGAFGLDGEADVLSLFDRGGMLDAVQHNCVALVTRDPELERSLRRAVMRTVADGPLSGIYLLRHQAYSLNPREKQFIAAFRERLRTVYGNQTEGGKAYEDWIQ